jgi:uncharacterized membrane protein YfcA
MLVALILTGVGASVVGSIVGLGGGFIAGPVLRIFFHLAPGVAAAASLVLVFANTLSASVHFAGQKRIAFDLAIPIAIFALPGSIAGAYVSAHTNASVFDTLYAVFLCVVAIDVLRRTVRTPALPQAPREGLRPSWYVLLPAGLAVGFVSSLFGIGGGVVVIPLLLLLTNEEMHVVTATSTAIIAMTAPAGIITQGFQHDLQWSTSIALAAGGLAGGQIGAVFAQRISSPHLSILLAVMMGLAAAAMALRHFF